MNSGEDSSNLPTLNRSKKLKSHIKTLSDDDDEIPTLPPEIIVEILTRLPVKSLLKFRCVSKPWRSLISTPQFIKSHLKNSTNDPNLSGHRLMLTIPNPNFDLRHCPVQSLISDHLTVAHTADYPKKNPHSAVWVVGSYNGLICIAIDESNMFIWNPSTRKSKKLPPIAHNLGQVSKYIWGFGYEESRDDYKVVGIFSAFRHYGNYKSVVKIYSLRADSWKSIQCFEGDVPFDDTGKFASGKIHFPLTEDDEWNIVSIDLKSEVYGIVEQPDYGEFCFESNLGVLGGCICVLRNQEKVRVDLWVMKEYDVRDSWMKVVSIPYGDYPGSFFISIPLCMLPGGKILLALGTEFVVYDPVSNTFRRSETSNAGSFLQANIYVESLVSLEMQD